MATVLQHARKVKGWWDNFKRFFGIGKDTVTAYNNALQWVAIWDLAWNNAYIREAGDDYKVAADLALFDYANWEAVRS